jgi:outer membrane protein TolC
MHIRIEMSVFLMLFLAPSGAPAQPGPNESDRGQAAAAKPTLRLSLKQAVDIALGPEGNTRVRLAQELIRQAHSLAAQARAALLPNIESSVGQQSQTRNLAAFGIRIQLPIPGFVFPSFVGPFNVFDARATASQTLFDMSAIKRFQASREGISQAEAEKEAAQDQTRDQVARAYLAGLRALADVEAGEANVALSEALLKLASDQKTAGTATGIEVTRAKVQLANEKQRLLVAQNELNRAHLQLLRAMALDLDVKVELTDRLSFIPVEPLSPQQALQTALQSRADWNAEQKRHEGIRLNASATKSERLPSVNLFADYGSVGSSINHAIPTRTYGFSVRVPIFDGGRQDARREEGYSQLKQENLRINDLRAQIELDVRLALDALSSSTAQVTAAEEGLSLAENELAQAERRYKAGVGSSIEVTDAQTRLERARENRIQALFNYNLARIDMTSATGTIRQMVQ